MATTLTLLYPLPAVGAKPFNLDYYLNTHIPMAHDAWSSYGLTKYQVAKLVPESGYSVQCIMSWESAEGLGKALKEKGAVVMGDLKNFHTGKPTVIQGIVVGGN